jgi:hypothetical protein
VEARESEIEHRKEDLEDWRAACDVMGNLSAASKYMVLEKPSWKASEDNVIFHQTDARNLYISIHITA